MGSTTEIDKDNTIPATYEHLPEEVRLLLEESKKKRDEEDLLAALASIKVDRRGKVTKIKENTCCECSIFWCYYGTNSEIAS